jgi:hypothetical protein
MITASLTTRFEDLLTSERLADVSAAFGGRDFCDEVPLYSRYEQIAFLAESGDINRALLQLSLDYLDRILASIAPAPDGWAAISVVQDTESEPIVPAVFLCTRQGKERLSQLRLAVDTRTELGRLVKGLVGATRPDGPAYCILEDTETVPDQVRVFVSKQMPPVPVLMT